MPLIYDKENFPPELDARILNFLADDYASLEACALVCRPWLAASRAIMFRDVKIETQRQYIRFEETSKTSPMICDCVRILQIDKRNHRYELNYPWVNDRLSPVLPEKLTKCHTLVLAGVDESWGAETLKNLSKFESITALSLIKFGASVAELYALICAFPNLKALTIEGYTELFNARACVDELPRVFSPHIVHLRLCTEDLPMERHDGRPYPPIPFFRWFLETGSKDSLRELTLIIGNRDIEASGRFLGEIGSSLEELELAFLRRFGRHGEESNIIANNIDLGCHTNLLSLTLPDPSHPAVCKLLPRVSSPRIRKVAFRLTVYRIDELNKIDHELVQQVLTASNFERLAEVCFLYHGIIDFDAVREALVKAYPTLAKRGTLRIINKT